jgi:trigger factor
LKSQLKSSEGLNREIEVEVPVEKVDAAFTKYYDQFRKQAKIKGFRPGKAPMNVIKSMYGQSIEAEVFQELISDSYPKALKELELKAAGQPDIPEFELKQGQPLKYTAKIEVVPEISELKYDGLKLPDEKIEIRDTEINAVVDYLRKKQSILSKVDREAKENDVLIVDLVKLDDPNNAVKIKEFNDNEIDLSSGMAIKEFRDELIGTKVGDEKEVTVNYPADYQAEMLRGQTIKYLCKVKEVKERILPPENDEFAKKQGPGIETLLEMRLKIREDLTQQKEMDRRKWRKEEIRRQFAELNNIELPKSMVEGYVESMLEQAQKEHPGMDSGAMKQFYSQMAEDGIRWNLLRDKICKDENIEVLPSDTEHWIKGFAESHKMEVEKAKEVLAQTGRIDELRDGILEDKIFDFLMTKASLVPADQFTGKETDAGKEETADKDNKLTEEK